MPINFQRDDSQRLVVVVGSGTVTMDEWASVVARQLSEGLWRYGTLFDFTSVDEMVGFDEAGVKTSLIEISDAHGRRGPVALVSPSPAIYRGFSEYAEKLNALPYQTRAFRDVNQAVVWLEQELSKPRQA